MLHESEKMFSLTSLRVLSGKLSQGVVLRTPVFMAGKGLPNRRRESGSNTRLLCMNHR